MRSPTSSLRISPRLQRTGIFFVTDVSSSSETNRGSPTNLLKSGDVDRAARLGSLMLRAQGGDEAAYRVLLTELGGHLRAFFRRRAQTLAGDIEDLVQETLLAIHNQRHTYDAAQPLTAWCYAIARYKLIDLLRRRGRREALTDPLDDASELVGASDTDAGDARRDLAQLLQGLPERQRVAIVHVKIEGHSVAATAALTRMSQAAIKVNVHRGLKALAKAVARTP